MTAVPGVTYDPIRRDWRVAITVNNQRVFRRAKSHAEALALRASLVSLQERDAFARLRRGATLLDLSGLTDEQIATIIMVIQSWGIAQPLREEPA